MGWLLCLIGAHSRRLFRTICDFPHMTVRAPAASCDDADGTSRGRELSIPSLSHRKPHCRRHDGPVMRPAPSIRRLKDIPACLLPSQPSRRQGRLPGVARLFDRTRSRPQAQARRGADGRRLRQTRQDRHGRRGLSEAADLSRHRRQARRQDGREGAAILHDQGRRRGLPQAPTTAARTPAGTWSATAPRPATARAA